MEIILTLSVLIALVALGVTISLGNERLFLSNENEPTLTTKTSPVG